MFINAGLPKFVPGEDKPVTVMFLEATNTQGW
jgi:hypothetical protein